MRTLVWITLGFAAGCGICGYQLTAMDHPVLFAVTFFLSALLFFLGKDRRACKAAAILLLGLGFGCFWYRSYSEFYLANASAVDGVTAQGEILTTDFSFPTGYGRGIDGTLELNGKEYTVRAYLDEGEQLPPGTVLRGDFRFRMTAPNSLEGETYHSGKGIFLLAYQKGDVAASPAEENNLRIQAALLRSGVAKILEDSLPEAAVPFSKALLLGDATELSYEVDTALKVSGIRHVAAVSGLHVSIVFALAIHLAMRKRGLSVILGLPMLFGFAAVAGFTPSVTRACIMSGLMLLALLVKREYDGGSALSFSALVMLLRNPLTITDLSFQLSCASVAGILLFSGSISRHLQSYLGECKGRSFRSKIKRAILASVSTSVSAMAFSIPLCAISFGTVSLIGVVTNLLTLWIITGIFYGLMVLCGVYLVYPGAAAFLGTILAWPVRLVLLASRLLSKVSYGCLYTVSPYISIWLIFVYVLLLVCLLWRKAGFRMPVSLAAAGLVLALICSWGDGALHDTSITVLDVGQGQSILLQSKGRNYLVDCGGTRDDTAADTAAQWLLSHGISTLDGLIVTHLDRDHMGGVENLLTRVDTALLILPPEASALSEKTDAVVHADRELTISWSDVNLRIFGEKTKGAENENSICVLLDTENCDILITGDRDAQGEARLLSALGNTDVDILVAGHHGSKNATSEALLQAVTPEIVCISVGEENIYGHPAPETLNRLYRYGCRVYRTDVHGTITIRR